MPNRKLTKKELQARLDERLHGAVTILECDGSDSSAKLACNECGHVWETCSIGKFVKDGECPICRARNRKIAQGQRLKSRIESRTDQDITVTEDFIGTGPVHLHCNVCGHDWTVKSAWDVASGRRSGNGCPICATARMPKNQNISPKEDINNG